MIWGEIINSVRKLHLDLIRECSIPTAIVAKDLELGATSIPFPEAIDDYDDWQETELPQDLQDLIPLHPVERALLEGPVLPIQQVKFHSGSEIERLFAVILALEKAWLEKSNLLAPDRIQFVETGIAVASLKISSLAGFRKLKPMKEI